VKERRWSKFWAVALSLTLTLTMLPNVAPNTVAAADEDTNYLATPEAVREITTGTADERTWKINWSDEFDADLLDSSKWSYMIGSGTEYAGDGWGNNEQEYYTNGENAEVSEGNLKITAKKLSDAEKALYGGKNYTSTRLWTMDDSSNPGGSKTTKFAKKYGRIEARVKITSDAPDGNSTGLWPAFWMMPSEDVYGTWAASGEIDIMEIRGREPGSVDGTIHFGSMWPNNKSKGGTYNSANQLTTYDTNFTTTEYHTYAIEWLPGEICWYIDDMLYYKTSDWYSTSSNNATDFTYPAPFNQNFYILLNLAVGGNYDGGALSDSWNNAEMDVDYVRVYDLIDPTSGDIADYSLMEDQAIKPVDQADDTLVSGTINVTNYVASDLSGIKATTAYPTETENSWYLATMLGGTATTNMVGDALKVDVTAPGSQNYSVQLIHNVPLTKGYRYVLTFDAKADGNKTLTAKYGNNAGYPAYSDSYPVDLTADWKSYNYTFDMTNKTDATGRIELNLGLTSGACNFKNFSVICTGLTPTIGEDDSKEPLANGNQVYNGTFDQGTGRYYYWHAASGSSISVDKANYELMVVGTSDSSNVYQKGMNLLGGESYQVSFDAKSITSDDISVKLVSSDHATTYVEKTIHIGNSYTTDPYSFNFVLDPGETDTQGVLEIVTGNKIVYLDNISMIRTSNNNVDWSNVDFWPLYNGNFYNGDDSWNIWSEKAGSQSHTVTNGVLNVHSTIGANPDFWCVGVQSSSMAFAEGIPYKFTVHLKGSKAKTIKIETPDSVQKDYNFVAGDNTVSIEFVPNKDMNGKISMYFGIGEGAYDFTIDSIEAEVDSSKITIPTGHAKPGSVASAGDIRVGTNIVINYSDEDWASKITTVYVDGTAIDPNAITVNHNNTLTIASNTMQVAGNYSIKFDAAGYAQTKAITQTVLEASGNLITNGSFDTDLSGWTSYFSSWNIPNGTAVVQDGKVVINVVSTEGNNWDCQFKQDKIDVEANNYYILQFDASSSVDRPIQLEFTNLGTASQTIVNLTNTTDTYYIVLSGVGASNAASVLFMTGNVNGCLGDFPSVGAHSISIDNVKLYATTKEQVDSLQNPTITLSNSVVVGNDIVLQYTENANWETKPINVALNGVNISTAVILNKEMNTLTIDKNVVTQPGTYDFMIKADGFKVITAIVKVLATKGENLFVGDWVIWVGDGDQGAVNGNNDGLSIDFVSTVTSQWNGPEFWSMQARKVGITTYAGNEYKLTFDADLIYDDPAVTDNRNLVIEIGSQAAQQVFIITPGTGSYEFVISPGARSDFYILFLAGGNEFNVKAHTLNITNIRFAEVVNEPEIITLETPTNVSAVKQLDANSVSVNWDAVSGSALSYSIYRSDLADGINTYIGSSVSNSYTDSGLNPGTYYYTVKAVPEGGSLLYKESALSNPSLAVIIPQVTVAVSEVTLNSITSELSLGSSLQMNASVLPVSATNSAVSWSVENGTGTATISEGGLLTATSVGSVTVRATAKDGSGVYGTKVITIYYIPSNPTNNTPDPSTTGNNNSSPSSQEKDKGLIKVDISEEDMRSSEGEIVVPVSVEDINEVLSVSDILTITISLTLPNASSYDGNRSPDITLDSEVLQAIKDSGKSLTISIKNHEGLIVYSWTLDSDELISSDKKIADVNLGLDRIALQDSEGLLELNSDNNLGEGVVIHFNQEGLLPSQAGIRVYVGDILETQSATKVFLYRYNKETGELETLPYSSEYVADSEGYININVVYGADYVVLLQRADSEDIRSLREQIEVASASNTLSLSSSKKNKTMIKVELPPSLEIVDKLTDLASQSAIGGVTVSFTSSNEDVATVDENGVITAVGKGVTEITTLVTLYSGKIKIVKTIITVK